MKVKVIAAAFLLGLLPAVTAAAGCSWEHREQSVSQCPEGQVLDGTTGSCVSKTTS